MSISGERFPGGMDSAPDGGGPDRKRWRGGRRRRRRRGGGGGGGGVVAVAVAAATAAAVIRRRRWRRLRRWWRRQLREGTGGGGGGGNGGGGNGGGGGDYRPVVEGPTEETIGVLEYTKEGNGWLRKKQNSYMPDSIPNGDVFVPAALIRSVPSAGRQRDQSARPACPTAARSATRWQPIDQVDGVPPEERREMKTFREMTVIDPEPMFVLAPGDDEDISLRIVDLLCPIGRGQRGLVVAPPRSGKTC
jgi:hypothetical protein